MFEQNEENDAIVDRLFAVLASKQRGQIAYHDELEEASGLMRRDGLYVRLVRRARNRLRDDPAHGVWSHPVRGVGFKLQTYEMTISEEPERRFKRARKQIGFGQRAVIVLPRFKLAPHLDRLRDARLEDMAEKQRVLAARKEQAEKNALPFPGLPYGA